MRKVGTIEFDYHDIDDVLFSLTDYTMRISENVSPMYSQLVTLYQVKKFYEKLRKRQFNMIENGRKEIKVGLDVMEAMIICHALKQSMGTKGGNKFLAEFGKYELKHVQYEVNRNA